MTSRKERAQELDKGYSINVTGRHVAITEAMKQYAIQKIQKLEQIAPRIIDVAVTMDIQKLNHNVDIVVKYGHTLVKSHATTNDMYASVDIAVHRLEAQLVKYIKRLNEHHAKGHEVREMVETVYEAIEAEEGDIDEINAAIERESARRENGVLRLPQIMRSEKQSLKILTTDEAIIEMDLSKASVIIFRGEADRKLKVLYKRPDGNLGLVEAE
ncbi:MAG TPA: ribosome-associated translation inhibitor RaiA [Chlamydiales bacterium]|nr:ribosome-associated translation inhibitor RaiA [Chlamydiales bacterium]